MKIVEDYLNDPRIVNDPDMSEALEPIIEIHAIRLMIQDETEGMTTAEKEALSRKKADALFASLELPPPKYVNLTSCFPPTTLPKNIKP